TPYAWALAVTLAVLFIVCAAVVFARRRVTLPVLMEDVTVLGLVAVACLMLLSNLGLLVSSDSYHFGARSTDFDVVRLSWLVIPAVLLFVLSRIGRNSKLAYAGRALLISDAAFMLIPWIGYQELIRVGTIALAIGYLVLLAVLGWYAWTTLAKEFRAKNQQTFIFCLQLAFLGSLASVLLRAELDFGLELWLLCVICCLLVLHLLRLDKKVLWYRLQEFVVSLGIAADLANGVTNPVGKTLAVVAAIVCLLAMAERIRLASSANAKAAREKTLDPSKQGLEYLTAFCVNALFLSILYAVTTWFTQAYPFSLSCMFIALVLIALGFWSRTTPFRLYGLVVTILCVLKLVTWDIVSADSLMRVIAFIGGGLICFGISALYNFAVKRFTDAPTQNHSEPASKPDHHSAP
ncbi:MAG: DUF2339 domain-containing protein, partial [Propionibacteriaceae bacterium]|nr:DUF2339 domain-containing protein [Propionibacteriaceae bacterium]